MSATAAPFWWGTATSSAHVEGAGASSDWFAWEQAGQAPPSGTGTDFATRYAEDFALVAGLGLRHHRFNIDWSRIEPEPGQHDLAAIELYREMLVSARRHGLEPWLCLHHFLLPRWFVAVGGFADDDARETYWTRHVAFCAETFGDLVFGWKPINEPVGWNVGAHTLGIFPPGRAASDQFAPSLRGTMLAWRDAWRGLRSDKPVASIFDLPPVVATATTAEAEHTRGRLEDLYWGTVIRALRDGVVALPGRQVEHVPDLAGSCDIVGFSYYFGLTADADGMPQTYPREGRPGSSGYVPWPAGMGLVLRRLRDEFPDLPLLACEVGVATDDDDWRSEVLSETVVEIGRAMADGCDVRGIFHWTNVDNYEWQTGFDAKYGLCDIERRPKRSAVLAASWAAGNWPADDAYTSDPASGGVRAT